MREYKRENERNKEFEVSKLKKYQKSVDKMKKKYYNRKRVNEGNLNQNGFLPESAQRKHSFG